MDKTKFVWVSVVVFVVTYALGFLFHGILLNADYARFPNLMRTQAEMMQRMYWMLLADAFFAIAFTWIYLQGLKRSAWVGQGVRYGVAVFAVAQLPDYMITHAVQPWPAPVTLKQICVELIRMLVLGVLIGFFYRKEAAAAKA
jgi:hypothetical protein